MQSTLLREVSRTFALTIPLLNAPLIPVITDAYLFLRILDTIEDEEALEFEDQKKFIKIWIESLHNPETLPEFIQQIVPLLTKTQKRGSFSWYKTPLFLSKESLPTTKQYKKASIG